MKPTGAFVSLKAGSRAMPWESIKCELPALELAEAAAPVVRLMAQPHRLEMNVRGRARPLVYFADLELEVEATLASALTRGVPYAEALLDWVPDQSADRTVRKIVIEVKDDNDSRSSDLEYRDKLRLAASVYRSIGTEFFTIVRSRDIDCADRSAVRDIILDRYTKILPADTSLVMNYLAAKGGRAEYGDLVELLGGGALGRAKIAAMHVRRTVAILLSDVLRASTPVYLMKFQG
jgi:hypothetical protein